jgi:hypothetical protein
MMHSRLSLFGSFRSMVVIGFSATILACGDASMRSQLDSSSDDAWQYVRIPRNMTSAKELKEIGFEMDHKHDDRFVFGYLRKTSLDNLTDLRFDLIDPIIAVQDFDAETLEPKLDAATNFEDLKIGYHNYTALTAELNRIASAYPDIIQLQSAGKSVEQRELWYVKISDQVEVDEEEPKMLYLANMHGDEVVGREMMLLLIDELARNYGKNQKITELINHSQIYIMPSMNPDGFERHQRWNARNADLNRDFPDFTSDPENTTSNRQIETGHVMRLHQQHHFALALNFHGGTVCMNLPWDTQPNEPTSEKFADDALLNALARAYANASPEMLENHGSSFERGVTYGYEWYEVDGGLQDWSIHYDQSAHATVELSHPKWPSAGDLESYWNTNRAPMIDYLSEIRQGVFVEVVDQNGRRIQNISAQLADSPRWIQYPNGLIFRPAQAGRHQLQIQAEGFSAAQLQTESSIFSGGFRTVQLR